MSAPDPSAAGRGAPRYGMVVDLNRCVGCQTCTIACKHHNDTPPGCSGDGSSTSSRASTRTSNGSSSLPAASTARSPLRPGVPDRGHPPAGGRARHHGLRHLHRMRLLRGGVPYQARTIAHDYEWYFGAPSRQEEQVFDEDRLGVATKCTFCVDKIDEAAGSPDVVPGLDLEATPACAASCIAQALHFGDFADPASNVSRLARENAHFQMHAELGTDPQIRYLYEVPETTPGREGEAPDDEGGSDPNDPLVGERQTFWDIRAAMNFTLGGMSSGFAVAAFLAWVLGGVPDAVLPWFSPPRASEWPSGSSSSSTKSAAPRASSTCSAAPKARG